MRAVLHRCVAPKWRIRKRVPRGRRRTCGQLDSFSISEKVYDPRDPLPRTKACAKRNGRKLEEDECRRKENRKKQRKKAIENTAAVILVK